MNSVKIAFFDYDGTLFDQRAGRIPDTTVYTLQQLHKNGIKCCLITGRPPYNLPDFRDVKFDVISNFNGAYCRADNEVIFNNPVDPDEAKIVMANAAALNRPVSIALLDRLSANGFDEDLNGYYRQAGLELTVDNDFETACQEDIYQVMAGSTKSQQEAFLRGTHKVKLAISWERAVDVIPLSGGKGVAVSEILKFFHLDASEAIAFGDSHNDIEMLQAVGTGIAMGNASPQLKAIADHICGAVSEDGIYHYCVDNGLIEA